MLAHQSGTKYQILSPHLRSVLLLPSPLRFAFPPSILLLTGLSSTCARRRAAVSHPHLAVFIAAWKMECSTALILLLLVHVMMDAGPSIALKVEPTGTSTHTPPLLDSAPARAPAARSDNLSAFRGNVLALLRALPAAAAAEPAGSVADAQSGGGSGGDDDRAFARAFCFGSVPCLECVSAAAQDVANGCHGRRGAVWLDGCFVSYVDTNASTPREDAWRGWFYSYDDDDTQGTAALGTCVASPNPNRTAAAAACSRCLNDSAQVVPALKEGRQLSLAHGDAVLVVGYSCYLRVPLFPPKLRWPEWVTHALGVLDVVGLLVIEIGGIICCIRVARRLNPAA